MEVWKEIKGFEGLYRVSNTGKVFSIRRNIILKPKISKDGYYVVNLYKDRNNHRRVHRLVAEAFVEAKEGCDIVNHLDCNKLNNNASNLEWTTVRGNTIHAYQNNKMYHDHVQRINKMGIEKRKLKLDVYFNGEYVGSFNSKEETAKELHISPKTIYNGLHNKFESRTGYTFVARG